jgi:hypothetical protein
MTQDELVERVARAIFDGELRPGGRGHITLPYDVVKEKYIVVARAALAAMPSAIPPGYKLVPLKPTNKMVDAAIMAFYGYNKIEAEPDMKDAYQAFISNLPKLEE